jgi:hypothetical protein
MSVPFYLQQGLCLIYGKDLVSRSGIQATDINWKWGSIYDINYLAVPIYQFHVGDQVLYNSEDVDVRLAYFTEPNSPYTVYETSKLAGRDNPIP